MVKVFKSYEEDFKKKKEQEEKKHLQREVFHQGFVIGGVVGYEVGKRQGREEAFEQIEQEIDKQLQPREDFDALFLGEDLFSPSSSSQGLLSKCRRKAMNVLSSLVWIIILCVAGACLIRGCSAIFHDNIGYVRVSKGANIRTSSNVDSPVVRAIPAKTKVYVFKEKEGWYHIGVTSQKPIGWIYGKLIKMR